MGRFREYIKTNFRNNGMGMLEGCSTIHIERHWLDTPGQIKISEFRKIRDALGIPEREMEQKILEIYRHGDLENRY